MSNVIARRQLSLDLRTWGGKRRNSGRKPKGPRALLRHCARPRIAPSTPVHATIRMRPEISNLRTKDTYRVIASALAAGGERFGLRVVHHSVQSNHIHLIAEAPDAHALGRGMQGLGIRIARRLNALARRHGSVLADRYHTHVLRTPREVRHCLLYVLNNGRKHAAQRGVACGPTWLDPYSSARRFDGWSPAAVTDSPPDLDPPPWVAPSTWLLRTGWRRYGPLPVAEVPSRTLLVRARRAGDRRGAG